MTTYHHADSLRGIYADVRNVPIVAVSYLYIIAVPCGDSWEYVGACDASDTASRWAKKCNGYAFNLMLGYFD